MNLRSIVFGLGIFTALNACGKKSDDASGDNFTLKGSGTTGSSFEGNSATTADTSTATLKVYKFAVSKSENCTDLVTVFTSASGSDVEMNSSPTIGAGQLADGTYKCAAMEMSDKIKFKPKTTITTACKADTESTLDVCRSGTSSKLIDGTTVACDGNENKVVVYISTLSTQENGTDGHNGFLPPTTTAEAATRGFKLSSALTIAGAVTGSYVMDTRGKVSESTNNGALTCEMGPPKFTFKM